MSDWSKPTLTSTYTNFITELGTRLDDAGKQCRSDTVPLTLPPTGLIRWNVGSALWESNTGTPAAPAWTAIATTYAINVATAAKWATVRTISHTGDVTAPATNIDGSGNISLATTLATVNANVGAFGSAAAVPVITVNAKGLVTAVSTAALGTMATQAATSVAITGGAVSATSLTLVQSTTAAPTAEGRVEWDTDNDLLVIGNGAGSASFAPLAPTTAVTETNRTFSTACNWNGNAVPVAYGGTGGTTQGTAQTALGLGSMATQASTSVSVTGGAISATALTLVQSTTAAPTAEGRIEWDTDDDVLVIGTGAASKVFAPLSPTVAVTETNRTFSTSCNWNGNAVPVTYGGTGAATLTGVVFGNGTGAMSAATAAQVVAAIGVTYVSNAGWATSAGSATSAGTCSGNSSTATDATRALNFNSTSHPGTYWIVNNWDGAYWYQTSNHGAAVRVGYSDVSGSCAGNAASASTAAACSGNAASASTAAACSGTAATANATNASNNFQMNSLGIGTPGSGTAGEIRATNNITAYYSDERLKDVIEVIPDALDKVNRLSGVRYRANAIAGKFGYDTARIEVGVLAQQVQAELPEVVVPAPFDIAQREDGTEYSASGENYLTVHYERIVPLLIEAIKELSDKVKALEEAK